MLRIASHAHQSGQALGVAESKRGQVHNHRPAEAIDDIPDVADGGLSADDVKLAAEAHNGLASGDDPVAQLQRRGSFQIILRRDSHFPNGSYISNVREHPGLPPPAGSARACSASMHVSGLWVITRDRKSV